jgi:hypothetical protein
MEVVFIEHAARDHGELILSSILMRFPCIFWFCVKKSLTLSGLQNYVEPW